MFGIPFSMWTTANNTSEEPWKVEPYTRGLPIIKDYEDNNIDSMAGVDAACDALESLYKSNPPTNPKDKIGITKPSLSLVPASAILLESEAFKDGALKYGSYNFRATKVRASVYIDAAYRHLLSYLDGEQRTRDSGVDHRAAVRACMAILIDAEQTGNLIDDRPSKGTASDLIDQLSAKKSNKIVGEGLRHCPGEWRTITPTDKPLRVDTSDLAKPEKK